VFGRVRECVVGGQKTSGPRLWRGERGGSGGTLAAEGRADGRNAPREQIVNQAC
jgi:hypothetical protein